MGSMKGDQGIIDKSQSYGNQDGPDEKGNHRFNTAVAMGVLGLPEMTSRVLISARGTSVAES